MSYIIVGLGNPDKKYENTRHNAGRIVLEGFREKNKFPEWEFNKKANALISEDEATLVLPETYMNKSGTSVKKFIKNKDEFENLIVVHDDLDLPLGKFKIVFNRGSAGHKGVESIIDALGTKEFTRVRIGIVSPKLNAKEGIVSSDVGDANDFVLKKFTEAELKQLNNVSKKVGEALLSIIKDGREHAMNKYN